MWPAKDRPYLGTHITISCNFFLSLLLLLFYSIAMYVQHIYNKRMVGLCCKKEAQFRVKCAICVRLSPRDRRPLFICSRSALIHAFASVQQHKSIDLPQFIWTDTHWSALYRIDKSFQNRYLFGCSLCRERDNLWFLLYTFQIHIQ